MCDCVYFHLFSKHFSFIAGVATQVKEAAVLALDSDAGDVIPPSLRGAANSFDPSLGDSEGESCIKPGEYCRATFALSSPCCSGYYCGGQLDHPHAMTHPTCRKCLTNFFCPGRTPQN
ncbi:hypothetical protein THAOC_35362 [Thalassiosira oceanica]|uniref:Uncharacterized protein n=1 Tax=Thalassiosira oceanica TaxID=159749 RepID=K0RAC6_THAOC|nr:hypothetical protein THAOC_35362 [Thalassiosira oceanica]|eukprot:EJK45996.1 hypothetical protein THAOC_35362 [Thalassiosira oceanica]